MQNNKKVNSSTTKISNWEKIAGFTFGATFVTMLLVMSIFIPDPTPTQYAIFKTILAIAAAGIGGILAGTIHIEGSAQKWTVKAGGAIALFVIVYFFTPAPAKMTDEETKVIQNIEEGAIGVQHSGDGDVNIQR